MVDAKVTVYGAYWCPDCRLLKRFLGEQLIPYSWVAVEQNKDGAMFVLEKNFGKRIIPLFVKGYVENDEYGFIRSGHDLAHDDHLHKHSALPFESSVPGIFVAGDARYGSTKQVASAVGEGAAASISIREYLRKMG